MDLILARGARQVDKVPQNLLMYDEPIRAHMIPPGGKLPPPVTMKLRKVEPKNVGFFVDLNDWAYDLEQHITYPYMMHLGTSLAEREYYWIVRSLFEYAGQSLEVETKGELTKNDLQNARNMISKWNLLADIVVMPRKQAFKLHEENQLWDPHKIPDFYISNEQRGRHFWGCIDSLKIYIVQDFLRMKQ